MANPGNGGREPLRVAVEERPDGYKGLVRLIRLAVDCMYTDPAYFWSVVLG